MFHYDENVVLHDDICSVIRRKTRQLARHPAFTAEDRKDIEQELFRRPLERLGHYDPEKGEMKNWVAAVVRRIGKMMVREKQAKKRNPGVILSLDAPGADGEAIDVPDRRGTDRDLERSDLRAVLARVLARLPADDRDLAERLMKQTVPQVARDRKVPYGTLRRQVERLRRRFEDAGLRDYL